MIGDAISHTQQILKITMANDSCAIPMPCHHSTEECMNNPKGKRSKDGFFEMSWIIVHVVSAKSLLTMLLWLPQRPIEMEVLILQGSNFVLGIQTHAKGKFYVAHAMESLMKLKTYCIGLVPSYLSPRFSNVANTSNINS